jgi:hypothetical protein
MNFYTFVANILKGIDLTDCNPIILPDGNILKC